MVQLTGDFVTRLEMIAIRFVPGAQAIPTASVQALSACRVRRVDVANTRSPPLVGFLHVVPSDRTISFVNVLPCADHSECNEAELQAGKEWPCRHRLSSVK
jgi:hypothetical protein